MGLNMEIRKLAPGDRVLDYRILERLGQGGFGEVFRAEHEVLGTIVAIKVPRDGTGLAALRHEGVVQSSLRHPNIVATRELSISYDPPFVVMDYVDGDSLAELIRREGPLSWRRATRILLEVARALSYAHSKGVVHGDVKPANILVEPGREGRVLLTDFGLGRVFEGPQGNLQISRSLELATSGAEVQGTIRYLAPELLRGERADERADVFSFGVLLFEIVTGGLPEGREVPSDLVPKLPGQFDRLFEEAFARREKRPRSLAEAVATLESLLDEAPNAPAAVGPAPALAAPVVAPTVLPPARPAPLPLPAPTLVRRNQVFEAGVRTRPSAVFDASSAPEAAEVVQALPAGELAPAGPFAAATSAPHYQAWRADFLRDLQDFLAPNEGIGPCEAGEFDLCYGVNREGEPQHRVYALCVPRMDAKLALVLADRARHVFEQERGIWEKEVTFWVIADEIEDKDQVVWTFKSFCMGWWRRRRIVLQTREHLFASELGCDPRGNSLKRAFGEAAELALGIHPPRQPAPVHVVRAPRRPVRGAAWGASVAVLMSCGLLGSIGALELASRTMEARRDAHHQRHRGQRPALPSQASPEAGAAAVGQAIRGQAQDCAPEEDAAPQRERGHSHRKRHARPRSF